MSVPPKTDIIEMFQAKKDELLDEIATFRGSCQAGTLGDYSETGFLMALLLILVEDES